MAAVFICYIRLYDRESIFLETIYLVIEIKSFISRNVNQKFLRLIYQRIPIFFPGWFRDDETTIAKILDTANDWTIVASELLEQCLLSYMVDLNMISQMLKMRRPTKKKKSDIQLLNYTRY